MYTNSYYFYCFRSWTESPAHPLQLWLWCVRGTGANWQESQVRLQLSTDQSPQTRSYHQACEYADFFTHARVYGYTNRGQRCIWNTGYRMHCLPCIPCNPSCCPILEQMFPQLWLRPTGFNKSYVVTRGKTISLSYLRWIYADKLHFQGAL